MTGMPGFGRTHSGQEIWSIVLAVRHLGHLTSEDAAVLHAASAIGQRHHPDGDAPRARA